MAPSVLFLVSCLHSSAKSSMCYQQVGRGRPISIVPIPNDSRLLLKCGKITYFVPQIRKFVWQPNIIQPTCTAAPTLSAAVILYRCPSRVRRSCFSKLTAGSNSNKEVCIWNALEFGTQSCYI